MPTYLHLENAPRRQLPPGFTDGEIRYPESLVEHYLQAFTQPGGVVFDPFAGYGTTLLVAEALGRDGYGLEINPGKVRYVQGLMRHPGRLIHGDARRLLDYELPDFDLCMTSPPYTTRTDPDDALTDYARTGAGYAAYLEQLGAIFHQAATRMKPQARVVIEIANLRDADGVTPLAWDVAAQVGRSLRFEGETVICWDHYGHGYDHSYCLVFSKGTPA